MKWLRRIHFQFYLNIYVLELGTYLFDYDQSVREYNWVGLRFKIFRWEVFSFKLYQNDRRY